VDQRRSGVSEAVEQAKEAAGDKDVYVMGGADIIRQARVRGP
jgi:dihydrofolate reductase